jgi:hypothetical protein
VSPYEELRLLHSTLGEGEQRGGELCPFCRGGRSGEKSLSIKRHLGNSGSYICHRGQCGKEGHIGERYGTHYTPPNRKAEFEPRIFPGIIENEVPDHVREFYTNKYGWDAETALRAPIRWSPDYQRSVWEIVGPDGTVRGLELRSHRDKDRAKTLHYRHSPEPWVGHYRTAVHDSQGGSGAGSEQPGSTESRIVAVEDLVSAWRVSEVFNSAAIMGSHLNFDILMDLMEVSPNVVLCLDRDATAKAAKFTKRFGFLCPDLIYIPLQRDLKYENNESIKAIVESSF